MLSGVVTSDFFPTVVTVVSHQRAYIFAESMNNGTLYVGGPNVSSANGWPLPPGAGIVVESLAGEVVYAISDLPQKVRYMKVRTRPVRVQ